MLSSLMIKSIQCNGSAKESGRGKIINYLDPFQFILLLLCFQRHLNQQLLELLIAVINAELLKALKWLNEH